MPTPRTPTIPDDTPARWVTALWSLWVAPLAVAFEELQAQQELEALQQQRREREGTADTSTSDR